jgi:hypothetical protein
VVGHRQQDWTVDVLGRRQQGHAVTLVELTVRHKPKAHDNAWLSTESLSKHLSPIPDDDHGLAYPFVLKGPQDTHNERHLTD